MQLRDPRVVNAVSHMAYTQAEQGRDKKEMSAEDWAATLDYPVKAESGKLYIVQLDELDGELALGLVEARIEPDGTIKAMWFGRKGAGTSWGINPQFEVYMDGNGRIIDAIDPESFLYELDDKDLTDNSLRDKLKSPRLNSAFMLKLRELAKVKKLRVEDMAKTNQNSSTEIQLNPDFVRGLNVKQLQEKIEHCNISIPDEVKLKVDLRDLLLAFTMLVSDSIQQITLPPLPSMLFFEQQKDHVRARTAAGSLAEAAEQLAKKWRNLDGSQRKQFEKRAHESARSKKRSRPE